MRSPRKRAQSSKALTGGSNELFQRSRHSLKKSKRIESVVRYADGLIIIQICRTLSMFAQDHRLPVPRLTERRTRNPASAIRSPGVRGATCDRPNPAPDSRGSGPESLLLSTPGNPASLSRRPRALRLIIMSEHCHSWRPCRGPLHTVSPAFGKIAALSIERGFRRWRSFVQTVACRSRLFNCLFFETGPPGFLGTIKV